MGMIKVTIFQKTHSEGLSITTLKNLAQIKSDFLLFPEYFLVDSTVKNHNDLKDRTSAALEWLCKLSDVYKGIIIGGTFLQKKDDQIFIASPIISRGKIVDWSRKRKLSTPEKKIASPGAEPGIFILNNTRFAVLLAEDALVPDFYKELGDEGIKCVFIIISSFSGSEKKEQASKEENFLVKTAKDNGMMITKCAATGNMFSGSASGRSMVVSPTGLSWRVSAAEENTELIKTVMLNIAY